MTEIITKNVEYQIQFLVKTDSVTPKDLTGFSVLIQIRPYAESDVVLIEWNQDSPEVTFLPLLGSVTLNLPPSTTGAFAFKRGVMDILVVNAGDTDGDRSATVDVVVNSGVSRPL